MQAGIALVPLYSGLVLFGFVREAICLAILNIGADATHLTIKDLVARPRPPSGSIVVTVFNLGQQSFPSGHAAHTLAIYGFLFYLCLLALHHLFFFHATPTTEIYTLSLHDALPIFLVRPELRARYVRRRHQAFVAERVDLLPFEEVGRGARGRAAGRRFRRRGAVPAARDELVEPVLGLEQEDQIELLEIGRASCRERE